MKEQVIDTEVTGLTNVFFYAIDDINGITTLVQQAELLRKVSLRTFQEWRKILPGEKWSNFTEWPFHLQRRIFSFASLFFIEISFGLCAPHVAIILTLWGRTRLSLPTLITLLTRPHFLWASTTLEILPNSLRKYKETLLLHG